MASRLATSLEGNTSVQELYINILNLTVRGAIALMPFLQNSKSNLRILYLQGDCYLDDRDFPSQPTVIDVFVRAAISCKKACLKFHSCPIAVSTMLTLFSEGSTCTTPAYRTPSP